MSILFKDDTRLGRCKCTLSDGGQMHGLSEADPRRSQLTFVTSRESAESLDFSHLKRAREPVGRSKSGVQGKIADVFCGRSRQVPAGEVRRFAQHYVDATVVAQRSDATTHWVKRCLRESAVPILEISVPGTGQ